MFTIILTSYLTGYSTWLLVKDILPYLGITIVVLIPATILIFLVNSSLIVLVLQLIVGVGLYTGINKISGSRVQAEVFEYAFGRFRRK